MRKELKQFYAGNGDLREITRQQYESLYFNKWLNKYEITGDVTPEQINFIMRKFWADGTLCAFNIKNTESDLNPAGELCFTPYAPTMYNIYDYPVLALPVNVRGAPFIPTTPLKVDTDIVLGWCQPNKKPIKLIVAWYLDRITDAEMLINISKDTLKLPFLIAVTPEDKERMKSIINKIMGDESVVYCDFEDITALKTLANNNPYILDKLFQYKNERENELKTFLGIDNTGVYFKKEHINADEANANNEEINDGDDLFLSQIEIFFKKISDVLGHTITIKSKTPAVSSIHEDKPQEGEENNDFENTL